MAETAADQVERTITFWFGARDSAEFGAARAVWFRTDAEFDKAIAERFAGLCERAATGTLDHLSASAEGSLALVLMLDQFPRNMFRGTPRAFATDAKARDIADSALGQGFDRDLRLTMCQFLYLPFEHSEDLADQERSVALFRALGDERSLDYAVRHRDIVAEFGRFPHRNAVLGRTSTPAELDFLEGPGSSF